MSAERCEPGAAGALSGPIALVGGGEHCLACVDVIESTGDWIIRGVIDREPIHPSLECTALGGDEMIEELAGQDLRFLVSVGSLGARIVRKKLFDRIRRAGGTGAIVVASTARVSPRAALGEGSIAMHAVVVNPGTRIGENCIVNTGAIVEHTCMIGDHTHIAPGAVVNGSCTIGPLCYIGSGAVVKNGVTIGAGVVVGAGAVVVRDLPEEGTYAGVPARRLGDR